MNVMRISPHLEGFQTNPYTHIRVDSVGSAIS